MIEAIKLFLEDLNKDFETTLDKGLEITDYNYNYNKYNGYDVDVVFNYNNGSLEGLNIYLDEGRLPVPVVLQIEIENACIEFCSHLKENEDSEEGIAETNNSLTYNFN